LSKLTRLTPQENQEKTLLELLNSSTRTLRERGISLPRLNAEILLSHFSGLRRIDLYLEPHKIFSPEENAQWKNALGRRGEGYPLSYIIGYVEFMGLTIKVKEGVFIPRPETEILVEAVLHRFSSDSFLTILDLGTGCGAIALSLAYYLKRAKIYASDISPLALEVAKENVISLGLKERIELLGGDLFKPFESLGLVGNCDLVISNPPYVPSSRWKELPREIREFEPREALDGGKDGLEILRRIIKEGARFLKPKGVLALEIDDGQGEELIYLMKRTQWYQNFRLLQDYGGLERVVLAEKGEGSIHGQMVSQGRTDI